MGEQRSFYIDDFTDEVMPCSPDLESWAEWLSTPDDEDGLGFTHGSVSDGKTFSAVAIRWLPDIIATRANGQWMLSEQPNQGDFLAVRFGEGLGWSAENIPSPDLVLLPETAEYAWQPADPAELLLKWLREHDADCEDVEYVARGVNEDGWLVTYHAGPPAACTAERAS